MNKQTLLYILCISLTLHYVSAQTGTYKQRYSNSDYFLNTQIDSLKNVTYGKAIDYMGDSQDLKMDVYFPNTNTRRKVINCITPKYDFARIHDF